MSALGRVMFRNVAGNARKFVSAPAAAPRLCGLSTLIERKEMAEETRFIRKQETKREEELRARMQTILALKDDHADKQQLMSLLEKKDKKPEEDNRGVLEKLGLHDWKFAAPIGVLLAIPALHHEWIILDAELQVAACFALFCATMYHQTGDAVAKYFDEYSKEIEDDFKKSDEAALSQVHASMEATAKLLSVKDDYQNLFKLTDDIATTHAEALTLAEEHKYREAVVKKLDSLYALEESASTALRNRMVNTVKSDVVQTFTNDKRLKEAALNQAIAILAAGQGAKIGKDVVGESFVGAFSNYREAYSKQSPESDEILVQLQKDMAAIAEAPVVEAKGYNVYTHF